MDQLSILINLEGLGLRVEDSAQVVKAPSFPDFDRFAEDVNLSLQATQRMKMIFPIATGIAGLGKVKLAGKLRKLLARRNWVAVL